MRALKSSAESVFTLPPMLSHQMLALYDALASQLDENYVKSLDPQSFFPNEAQIPRDALQRYDRALRDLFVSLLQQGFTNELQNVIDALQSGFKELPEPVRNKTEVLPYCLESTYGEILKCLDIQTVYRILEQQNLLPAIIFHLSKRSTEDILVKLLQNEIDTRKCTYNTNGGVPFPQSIRYCLACKLHVCEVIIVVVYNW